MVPHGFIILGILPVLIASQRTESVQDLMFNVTSLESFLALLTNSDGRPVVESDIFSPFTTPDGKKVITGGGLMATNDECSPRNMSVRLPLDQSNNQIVYYPECTLVQRCGGCCPTQFLSCEPDYKERMILSVLRGRYPHPGARNFIWEGFQNVEVERHVSCKAVCRLTAEQCGPLKQFLPTQCKCRCLRFVQCYPNQRWDDETCSCKCINVRQCCTDDDEGRSCPYYFSPSNCECTAKSMIGASPNASQEEIEEWYNSRGFDPDGSVQTHTPEPSTTTTTTTTSTTTSPADPCQHVSCPRNFIRRMNSSGRCVCQLAGMTRPGK